MNGLSLLFMNSAKRASGGEYWMTQVTAEFMHRGHEVTFICRPGQPWAHEAREKGMQVIERGLHGDINLAEVARLAFILARRRIDVICTVFDREARLAGLANRLFPSISLVQMKVVSNLKDRFRYKASYKYLVDRIVAPSHSIESELTRHRWLPPGMVEVIPNGIDLSPFTSLNPSRLLSKQLGIPQGRVIVGTVADFVPTKGHSFLLDALPSILLLAPNTHLLFIGDGPERNQLEKKIQSGCFADRITFTGFRRDIPELLRNMDIFVLPSKAEGASLAVLEAMAAARPVIVSDVGGNSELVIHGINGYLFPLDDPLLMVQQIALMVVNPRLRRKMGLEGRRWVEREFTLGKMVSRLEDLFYRTVDEKRHRPSRQKAV